MRHELFWIIVSVAIYGLLRLERRVYRRNRKRHLSQTGYEFTERE